MRYLRVGPAGQERPVVAVDGRFHDLSSMTDDIDAAFLARAGGLGGADVSWPPEVDLAGQRTGPPIARPGVVLCIGQNYAAHAAESGSTPPTSPIMFYKAPNTVVGPDDEIRVPHGSTRTDWEVELGVVIGRTARYLDSPAEALSFVAGYVLSTDVSERTYQLDESGGRFPYLAAGDVVELEIEGLGRQRSTVA